MKKNLGRYFLVILFFCTTLFSSSEYSWSAWVNKKSVVTNEAIHLKYVCRFVDKSELYVIEFNPVADNERYKMELLSESETIENGQRVNRFEFVLFVKQAGEFNLSLNTTMKKTNKESIENGVLGRDNANYEEFSVTKIKQEPIVLDVRDAKSKLVGEFNLEVKQDKPEVGTYEPFHIEFVIRGVGDFFALKALNFKPQGVKVFSSKVEKNILLTKDGYRGEWRQKFAFVAKESFSIEPFTISYYDLKLGKVTNLKFKGVEVTIRAPKYKKAELLDKEKRPWSFFSQEYIYYFFTFVAGYIAAQFRFRSKLKFQSKKSDFCKKIESIKSINEVALFLVLEDAKKYEDIISKIETKELNKISQIKTILCERV